MKSMIPRTSFAVSRAPRSASGSARSQALGRGAPRHSLAAADREASHRVEAPALPPSGEARNCEGSPRERIPRSTKEVLREVLGTRDYCQDYGVELLPRDH